MKKVLAIALMAVMIAAMTACGNDKLADAVKSANAECPLKVGVITIESVAMDGAQVVYNVDMGSIPMSVLRVQEGITKQAFIKAMQLTGNESFKRITSLCKESGKDVKIVLSKDNDQLNLYIPADKLK